MVTNRSHHAIPRCLVLGTLLLGVTNVAIGDSTTSTLEKALNDHPQILDALQASTGVRVLAFSHTRLSWSAFGCRSIKIRNANPPSTTSQWTCAAEELERSSDATPSITRGFNDKFLLVVTDTNPFLYSYEGVALPSQDAPTLAALRTLATSAAAVIQPILAGRTVKAYFEGGKAGELETLSTNLGKAVDHLQAISLFVEGLELQEPGSPAPSLQPDVTPASISALSGSAQKGMAQIATLQAALRDKSCGCLGQWSVLLLLLSKPDITDEQIGAARADMSKTLSGGLQNCSDPFGQSGCSAAAPDPFTILQELAGAKGGTSTAGSPTQRELLRQRLLAGTEDERLKFVFLAARLEEFLKRRGEVAGLLARLELFKMIATRTASAVSGETWDLKLLTARVAFIAPDFEAQRWDKVYPGTVSIKADTSICQECTRVRPTTVDRKFVLASRRDSFLGVGFGVTLTSIKDPTFGKVSEAIPGSTMTKSVIGKTSEQSRSGSVVVLGFLRPWVLANSKHRRGVVEPGLEFGAGVDPKKPAAFLGLGFEFWKVVRLGFGETWQSVTALAPGLQAAKFGSDGKAIPGTGTVVVLDGDIRTRMRTVSRPYFSLVLAFDSLPIFASK